MTCVPTTEGFLYVAVVPDVFSRRMVGWSMATQMRAELVMDALGMAFARRRPPASLIHHSDNGSQDTSVLFGERCHAAGIRRSMGAIGDCFDNALAESFFAALECELLARQPSTRTLRRAPRSSPPARASTIAADATRR